MISKLCLILIGVLHLLPVAGAFSRSSLLRAYGLAEIDSNVELLLRHRAMLFAVVAIVALIGAFKTDYRPLAFAIVFLSMTSYSLLFWMMSGINESLRTVFHADNLGLGLLAIAVFADYYRS